MRVDRLPSDVSVQITMGYDEFAALLTALRGREKGRRTADDILTLKMLHDHLDSAIGYRQLINHTPPRTTEGASIVDVQVVEPEVGD